MTPWSQFKIQFAVTPLTEIYDNHIVLSGATGIDKINHEAFQKDQSKQIGIIATKAIAGTYRFTKYRLKLVSKGRGKPPREISIPTIRDRIALRALCDYLNCIFESDINFELPQNVIKSVKESLEANQYSGFIKLDVQSFYPSINHDILLDRIKAEITKPEILGLIRSAIETPTIEKPGDEATRNLRGVPQGLSISNILAAVYLADIDKRLRSEPISYYRYVDDILIFCRYTEAERIAKDVISEFEKIGLTVHKPTVGSEKSTIGKLDVGEFSYLGYRFLPDTVTVRSASLERLRDSLTSIFTAFKYSKRKDQDFLLWRLNLRITGCIFENKRKGWLFFFSEIDDLSLLHKLDHYVERLCKRFGVKIKPKSFVKAYFQLKHHIYESQYIPNFDEFSVDDMKNSLKTYFGFEQKKLNKMTHRKVTYLFLKRISRQVKDLDTDLQDVRS